MSLSIPVLAVIIAGTAASAAAAVLAALRDHQASAARQPGRHHPAPASDGLGPCLADSTVTGLVAAITAVAVAAGITAALWVTGQGHTALEALDLAGAAVITAGAGYAAGRRRSRAAVAPTGQMVPRRTAGLPAPPPDPSWDQDTREFGPEIAQWLREADTRPPSPRRRGDWRPFRPGDGSGPCPN